MLKPETERGPTLSTPAAPAPPHATLEAAALLTLSGGFLDAFTYVGHGHVFANAMTGNVVLLGVFAAAGDWPQAWRHIPPIIAFLLGVFTAQLLGRPSPRPLLRHPALLCLVLEILFLCGAAWLPVSFPDLWLVLGLSFVAALQNSSFPKVGSWSYNSVMTTGNLRRFAEGLFMAFQPGQRGDGLGQARTFGLVCTLFLLGAFTGAVCTPHLHNLALLIPAVLLTVVLLRIQRSLRHLRGGA